MTKHRNDLLYGRPVPQSFFDAWQEFISTLVVNFALTLAPGSMNQVQVVAGTGNAQVGVGIDGLWRYNTQTVTTLVAGPAATYDLFVTCGENDFQTNPSPPPPENDNTNYTFALTSVAAGQTPTGVPHFRRVGQALTDGTRILVLRQLVGGNVDGQQLLQPGMIQTTAAATVPPGWLPCNGAAVSRSTYAALYAALGGPNSPWGQGDGSTTFNVPDLRGRVQVGSGQGASPLSNRALGPGAGAERVTLAAEESGVNGSGTTDLAGAAHTHTWSGSGNFGGNAGANARHAHQVAFAVGMSTAQAGNTVNIMTYGTNYIIGPFNTGADSPDHGHTISVALSGTTSPGSENHSHALNAAPANDSHENMPPFAVVSVIIKT